ncbi:hypothetical protein PV325_002523 [Microctonus aethiopoides]|nr:hypothetical protein PV325_002523 [Microctonus aethiopoides]
MEARIKLASCVQDIPNAILNPAFNHDVAKARLAFRDMRKSICSIIEPLMAAQKRDADRIANLETCYGEMYSKWQNEKNKLDKAEEGILQLTAQTISQSQFCANLGAVLGNFLWISSKFPQMTNIWLHDNQTKMEEFLSIVKTVFESFVDTFKSNFPPLHNDECQFVMALMGTITNVSSTPLGRQFLATNHTGMNLIKQLIKSLALIPKESGDGLKRLMIMTLYNVSLNRVGLPFLLELKVDENIGPCLIDDTIAIDIQVSALYLLQSLTYNLTNPYILQRIIDSIPMDRIKSLAVSLNNDNNISKIAQEVVANINNCKSSADTVSQVSSSTDNN